MIVFIENGFDFTRSETTGILEIGFGTGLNALLTLNQARLNGRKVNYTAIEKYPLNEDITEKLNYNTWGGKELEGIYRKLHEAPWNRETEITESFKLTKLHIDFTSCDIYGSFGLIYFDAFGPDKQPEMWDEGLFRKIGSVTLQGGVLVTYSAK